MKGTKYAIFIIGALAAIAGLGAADLFCGAAATDAEVIRLLRLPRAVTAVLAGAALALAGTQMQSVLRNPLADPHIMGVSSGAALGAALATMWGGSGAGLTVAGAAFAGAAATASAIMAISKRFRSADTLLIFGVMLGFIANALISILESILQLVSGKFQHHYMASCRNHRICPDHRIYSGGKKPQRTGYHTLRR